MQKIKLLLFVFSLLSINLFAQDDVDEIKNYVQSFVNSLTAEQRKIALVNFNDSARLKWNNLPVGLRPRAGIKMGALTDEQRILLHRILSASLSSQGYLKATSIMHLDNLLNMYYDTLYQRKEIDETTYKRMRDLQWSTQNYFLALFNTPADSVW